MSPHPNATVYVIDDDASVRDALAWLLRSRRLLSETFDSAESFEAHITRDGFALSEPACALLDVRMGELSGLALFERLIERQLPTLMPVIFLTGHADVATAVKAVKRGAFDFCEKPFSDNALIDRVGLAGQAERPAGEITYIDQKRVELARALAAQPQVLLLDEWLAGLNPTELGVALELIRSLRGGNVTILMVEHVMDAIRSVCDRCVVMNAGAKIAEGPPAEVLADPAVITAYLGDDHA